MTSRIRVLGVSLDALRMSDVLAKIAHCLKTGVQTFIVTANTEIIMLCQKDDYFKSILATAEIVLPDGIGVVWAGKHLGYQVPERVAGFDLTQNILSLAGQNSYRVFFFGSSPGVAEKAAEKALLINPGLVVAGCQSGYFSPAESLDIVKRINEQQTDILLVALGAPRQEKWLYENRQFLQSKLLIGVGGTFDVMSGLAERAPLWMQKIGLEWFFRLCKQPSRIGRMLAIPKFILKIVFTKKH